MIGLINSAGSPEASRIQSTTDAGSKGKSGEKTGKRIPLPTNEQAVDQLLASAVQNVAFLAGDRQRGAPGGDSSDRFAQADTEAKLSSTIGTALDVQA